MSPDTTDLENPYQAPQSDDAPREEAATDVPKWVLRYWPFVFLANLVVPGLIAALIVSDYLTYVGIVAACGLLLLISWRILRALPDFSRSIFVAACLIAASQIFPILQAMAGTFGIGIAAGLGLVNPDSDDDHVMPEVLGIAGGFVVTLIVGTLLLTLCVGLGLIIHILNSYRRSASTIINS